MRLFHSLGIYLYGLVVFLAQPFSDKAKKWVKGRRNYWISLPTIPTENVIWFHCASLGEFDQGIPVMQALKEKYPSSYLVVTFFSPSGMEHYHKRNHPADWVGYLPLPTKANAKRFVQHFQPKTVFFVKYEFWEHYLNEAKKQQAKIYCISANFREDHRFFGTFSFLFKAVLFYFDTIFVQNERSKELLEKIGYSHAVVAGDTRIDKVLENKKKIYPDEIVEQFLQGQKAIVLGSSWAVGEKLWKSYIDAHPTQKFIIAPHDISEKHLQFIEQLFPNSFRYTQNKTENSNVLIIDCIGKLSNMYQYASLAYIGGGFTGKLHNILEATVFNIPVLIGPKHTNFPEAQALIDKGVVYTIQTANDCEKIIEAIDFNKVSEEAEKYFQENKNVAGKVVGKILRC